MMTREEKRSTWQQCMKSFAAAMPEMVCSDACDNSEAAKGTAPRSTASLSIALSSF